MQLFETLCKIFRWSIIPVVLLPILLLLSGCDRGAQKPQQRPAPQVSFVTVQPEKIMLISELPGRTSAFRIAEIRPQVSGLVLKRLFTEGANVEAGQVLYRIDPAPFQAALDNALAALGRAEANQPSAKSRVERFKALLKDRAVSKQSYDDATAALAQVEADIKSWKSTVETASINLGYTKITAPISGRIGKSGVTDGAIVTAYQPMPLATIQQMDPIYVDVHQSTTDLLRLQRRLKEGLFHQHKTDGNQVDLILEDGTRYPQNGILQFRDVTVDPTTGSVTLRSLFPNPEDVLLPGMFVHAVIREGVNEQAILVPQQGVSRDPKGNPYALIVDSESKAVFRPLTLDRAVGSKWLVAGGLAPGDRVIVEGLTMLRPGMVVKATPFAPKPDEHGSMTVPGTPPQKNGQGGVKVHQHAFFARSDRPAYRVYSLVDLLARRSCTGKLLRAAGTASLVAPGELIRGGE